MGDAPFPIRPLGDIDFPEFWEVVQEAFGNALPPTEREVVRPTLELDRTLGAFDGPQIVGTTGALSFEMSVPGGGRPVAGVTHVAVLPSHRRRGVLSGLMHRQLTDLHEHGEAVAALYASEAAIYARYGYGCAARQISMTVRRRESAFVPDAPCDSRLRLRLIPPAEAWPLLAAVYDAQLGDRPGQYARSGAWWNKRLHDSEYRRDRDGLLRCVLAEDEGGPRGYALFTIRQHWDADGLPDGELLVRELFATDPAAYAAVWRHLLERDLISTLYAGSRPVDDPLQHLLMDPRRLRTRLSDELWVRLVDVDRALAGRAYGSPIDVVIEVSDPVCVWNVGRWQLSGDATGATCTRTHRPADIALPVQVLGAAYLGGLGLAAPARAGLVRELHAGALSALSRALVWDPQPWCPMMF